MANCTVCEGKRGVNATAASAFASATPLSKRGMCAIHTRNSFNSAPSSRSMAISCAKANVYAPSTSLSRMAVSCQRNILRLSDRGTVGGLAVCSLSKGPMLGVTPKEGSCSTSIQRLTTKVCVTCILARNNDHPSVLGLLVRWLSLGWISLSSSVI